MALERAFKTLDHRQEGWVKKGVILMVLQKMRPHYTPAKIDVLYAFVDPEDVGSVSEEFFIRVIDALNLRVSTDWDTASSQASSQASSRASSRAKARF